jgi:rRNA processing protein Gar1
MSTLGPMQKVLADILDERERRTLDRVTDHVLTYHPKPKTKAAKKRARRNKRKKKRD